MTMSTEAKKRITRADLLTKQKANEGLWFPIPLPTGEDSGEKMRLIGADSAAFERAAVEHVRRMKEIEAIANEDEKRAAKKEASVKFTAAALVEWTFDGDPCTPAAVLETLQGAAYLVDAIDTIVMDRRRFYAGASSSLLGTPKRPTDSIDQPAKDQASP